MQPFSSKNSSTGRVLPPFSGVRPERPVFDSRGGANIGASTRGGNHTGGQAHGGASTRRCPTNHARRP